MAKDKEGHGSEGYLGSKEHSGRWNVAEGKDRGDVHGYNAEAVNKSIASSNRYGPKIGGKEARMIHAILKGRH
jgi:hypothetical protein